MLLLVSAHISICSKIMIEGGNGAAVMFSMGGRLNTITRLKSSGLSVSHNTIIF